MALQFKKAQRTEAKLRLALSGTSGSGKTYGALQLAKGLGGKIAVVDTERGSASLYAGLAGMPEFDVLELTEPFTPESYREAIKSAEEAGYDVLIIDSITHEWSGTGGCLELVDSIARAKYRGNSWSAWNDITPRHRKFIDAILNSKCHIICTMRSKTDTVQNKDSNGKTRVEKVGMKVEQRDGVEYEFTVVFDINDHDTHTAIASKDRTAMFRDPIILSEEIGKKIKAWLGSAVAVPAVDAKPKEETPTMEQHVNAPTDESPIIGDFKDKFAEAKTIEELKEIARGVPNDAPQSVKDALKEEYRKRLSILKGGK